MKVSANACEGVLNNPQLCGAITALVRSTYQKNKELLKASAFDQDDLFQELMLQLCEEPVKPYESHYQQLCKSRLLDILDKFSRAQTDRFGERALVLPLEAAFAVTQ